MNTEKLVKLIGTFITALAFCFEVWYVKIFYEDSINIYLILSTFFACFGGYFYLRFTQYNEINRVFFIFIISVVISTVTLYLSQRDLLSIQQWISLIISGVLLFMYHSKLFLNSIRNNVIMKPTIIAIVWMLLIFFYTQKFNYVLYLQQFIFIFLLTIPFDIKGVSKDKIVTIPKLLGINKTMWLLANLIILYITISLFLPKIYIFNSLLVGLITLFLIFNKFTYQKLFIYIFYDGIIVLQTLSLLVLINLNSILSYLQILQGHHLF